MKIALIPFLITTSIISSHGQTQNPQQQKNSTNHVYITVSDSTGKIMSEETFWNIIEQSKSLGQGNYVKQQEQLQLILCKLNEEQIIKFDNTFSLLMAASYEWKLWGAAYVINQGCSDDGFEYFRHYLIAQGENRFYSTLADPQSCVDWIQLDDDIIYEGLRYSAAKAYRNKTGKEFPYEFKVDYKIKGESWDEDTVSKKYPILAKKFWHQ